MDDFVVKAIEDYMRMEHDAKVIELLRKQTITGISRPIGGQWRVDTLVQFFLADTLEEALAKALGAEHGR
jgi:uncharacterized protein (DUF2164 family)